MLLVLFAALVSGSRHRHGHEARSLLEEPPQRAVWPVKREAVVEGDLVLGGLMMVHEREDTKICGPVMPQGGIQAVEAMLYTLDRINAGPRPFTIGAHILDDCDKDTYGLEMAVDFIKGSISNIDDSDFQCNKSTVRKVISGVVGAASSVTSIQVANLLRLFKIPQVSYMSTSPELSNKQRFEYFTRTIPSDHHQVKAMVEIVKLLNWSYVSIVFEESNYGIKIARITDAEDINNGRSDRATDENVEDGGSHIDKRAAAKRIDLDETAKRYYEIIRTGSPNEAKQAVIDLRKYLSRKG